MKGLLVVILFVTICFSVQAEMRIWQDKKGNTIEAEFVTMSAGKVVLRTEAGKQIKIDPAGLSSSDQTYLKRSIPPRIDIAFSKKQDRRKDEYWSSAEVTMSGSARFKKTNREQYSRKVKAVLMMVGEDQRTRDYVLLDRVEGEFDFEETKEFELSGQRFKMQEDHYDNSYGTDYVGFVAVVFSDDGVVLAVKSSRKDFEENCGKVAAFETGSRFSKKFAKVDRIRSY